MGIYVGLIFRMFSFFLFPSANPSLCLLAFSFPPPIHTHVDSSLHLFLCSTIFSLFSWICLLASLFLFLFRCPHSCFYSTFFVINYFISSPPYHSSLCICLSPIFFSLHFSFIFFLFTFLLSYFSSLLLPL